ncbi:MAG: glycosyltransferase 87 family protein, partial [Acidimicrobiales bacterium]
MSHDGPGGTVAPPPDGLGGRAQASPPGPDPARQGAQARPPGPDPARQGAQASPPGPDPARQGAQASPPGPDPARQAAQASPPGPDPARREARARASGRIGLGVAAAATAVVLLRGPSGSPGTNLVLLLAAFVGLGTLLVAELLRRDATPEPDRERHPVVSRRAVWLLSGGLMVLAVAVPPTESRDVWAYAMYGRMVSHYHESPYAHSPALHYPQDPWARRVDKVWRHTRSVYGPGFTAISALGTATVGRSPLGARLFFQVLSAAALLAALVLIERRTRSPVALALLGVNPLLVISVVNGAHNDSLVGLGILAGVVAVVARRPAWAGAALAAAALVKISALLPLAAIALWVWRRQGFRSAAVLAGVGGAVTLVGMAVPGIGAVWHSIHSAQYQVSGASVWWGPRRWLSVPAIRHGLSGARHGTDARLFVSSLGTLGAITLTLVLAARRLGHRDPALVAGSAVLAYVLLGAYVLPWYLVWGLPVMALAWRSRLTWLALLHGAVLMFAYLPNPRLEGRYVDPL